MVKAVYVALIALTLAACGFKDRNFGDRSCSTDQDCPRPDQSCSQNTCVQRSCTSPSDCGPGFAFDCVSGGCVATGCTTSSDCPIGFTCGAASYCQSSFNVVSAEAVSNTSLSITFDAPPDVGSAIIAANYVVNGLTISGTPAVSGSTVTLTTSPQTTTSYTVTVSGVTRASDQAPLDTATAKFTGRASFNVTSALATNARTVEITFDSNPDNATASSLANYMIDQGLAVTGTPVVAGNKVAVTTAPQAVVSYTVTVGGVTRASDGEALATKTAMFTGRNDFNVVSAGPVDSHTVTVTFDAPPDSAQATTLANYVIKDSSNVVLPISGSPTLSMDMLSVSIATSAQAASTYTVTVSNVTRASDAEPLNVRTANFNGRLPFNVASAASTSSTSMTLTFDAAPVTALANDVSNYSVPGLTLGSAALVGNTVTLTTSPQSNTTFTATVSNVVRNSDSEPLTQPSASFTGRPPFDVAAAASTTSETVNVTFDAPPNAAQAVVAANYSIPGLTVNNAAYGGTGNVVTLTTTGQSATTFNLTVSGVTRAADGEPLTLAVAMFTGRAPFDVSSAASVTSHSMTVTFDGTPNLSQAQNPLNYTVSGLTISTATLTGNTVTLTTTAQTATTYQVNVVGVNRSGDGEPLTNASATFMGRAPFNVSGASSTGNTTITVSFDAVPNSTQATNLANYQITSGSLSLSGTPVLAGSTVTITTTAQTSGSPYQITVTGVTRNSDSEPLTTNVAPFTGKSGFNVASAASVNTTTMSVTYDAPPDPTTAQNVNNYNVPGLTLSGPVSLTGSTVQMTTTAQAGATYTVTVANVVRAGDNVALTAKSASFTHTTFNVSSAAALNSHTMTVTYDALPNAAATTATNYTVKDKNGTTLMVSAPSLNSVTNTVTLTTATQDATKSPYTVTVMNVTRNSDGTTLTNATATFTGISPFNVMSAASATSASMTVTFDAPPDPTSATTLLNYNVPGLTLSGTPVLSGNVVTISTSVQSAIMYTVTVNNVTRASDAEPLTTKTAMFMGKAQTTATVTNVAVQSNPPNGTTFYNTGTATVVITGTQFTGTTCSGIKLDDKNGAGTVINTTAIAGCSVDSDTQITATFPAGIVTNGNTGWNVLVTNTSGTTNTTSSIKLVVKAGLLVANVYVQNFGTSGGIAHQFFEIYNPTGGAIDISSSSGIGVVVHFRSGSGTDTTPTLAIKGNGATSHKTIATHGYMLISSQQSTQTSPADPWFSCEDATYDQTVTGLVDNGSVYLSLSSTAQSKVIDKVGWGSQPSGGYEGTALGNDAHNANAQRKNGGTSGAAIDTDVNTSDFVFAGNSYWSTTIVPMCEASGGPFP